MYGWGCSSITQMPEREAVELFKVTCDGLRLVVGQ